MSQNAPSPPLPPGRQAEIELETAIERIIGHLGEMPRIMAAINDDTPQRRTAEKLLVLGQSLQEAHGNGPGNDIHAVLAGLGQAARLWLETEDDPNEPPPPAVVLLTGTITFIARATERAERAASLLGFGAGPQQELVAPVSRAENEQLLRTLATRIDAVRRELRALVTAASGSVSIETEPDVVRGYAAGMTVEIDLADLHLAVGHRKTSLSGLARATLAMAEMTGDFAATIRHWGNRASDGVQAGTSRMIAVVNKAVAGVGTITKAVMRRNAPGRTTPGQTNPDEIERGATAPPLIRRDGPDYPEMVLIPSGDFMMGAPEEESRREGTDDIDGGARPVHQVTVPQPFWMGRYPVTRGEFAAFIAGSGYQMPDGAYTYERDANGKWGYEHRANRNWRNPGFEQTNRDPVVCVSHTDALAYIDWLNRRTGGGYRLPSEAEWEYAARAGTTTARYWGNGMEQAHLYANMADQSLRKHLGAAAEGTRYTTGYDGFVFTSPVGSFRANKFGLHDVLGNVWEWCADPWHATYDGAPPEASVWLRGGAADRVIRGGSWFDVARGVRAAFRLGFDPAFRDDSLGFRCARVQ